MAEIVGDFLETCDAVGSLAADILVGASGGFVGGFVGVALSTGNLTAALHAGLISAAVGGAMGAAGNRWSGADPAASWKYPPNVISHAVVGCGGAMLSGGNCGKGALAAAVSDVAGGFVGSDSNPFSGKSLGNWGDIIQAAEVGLVGGGTAALSGGSFRDGFTTGAAGYLFNYDAHRTLNVWQATKEGQYLVFDINCDDSHHLEFSTGASDKSDPLTKISTEQCVSDSNSAPQSGILRKYDFVVIGTTSPITTQEYALVDREAKLANELRPQYEPPPVSAPPPVQLDRIIPPKN